MSSLVSAYGLPARSLSAFGRIEQEEWKPYTGGLTKYAMAKWFAGLIYEQDGDVKVDCGFDADGSVTTVINVYPNDIAKPYTPHLTHGSLGGAVVISETMEELIEFSMAKRGSLNYPCQSVVSVAWQGDCYDADLAVISKPALGVSADRKEVIASHEVYGTALVKYNVVRHSYAIAIPLRPDAEMNKFSSVFFVTWDGPVEFHRLSTPPGADEFEGGCGSGKSTIEPPDPDDPSLPDPHADRTTKRDWCEPSIIISDTTTGV